MTQPFTCINRLSQSQVERKSQRASQKVLPGWHDQSIEAPIVKGFRVLKQIGGGGFSKVYFATNQLGNTAAVKVVILNDGHTSPEIVDKRILREVKVHETLKHPNVLELLSHEGDTRQSGGRKEWKGIGPAYYIVLEFADGGDLFDRIAPDFGVPDAVAQCFFIQLVNGLSYVHKNGICHRDIKPENLLLGKDGNLKITDFGLCSVFKYKGQERLLNDACGSPPYAAPELAYGKPYKAEPIDIWSTGVVLFALLLGNTPWDMPTANSPEFAAYTSGELLKYDPWTRMDKSTLSLVRHLLAINPNERYTISKIKLHPWFNRPNIYLNESGIVDHPIPLSMALMRNLQIHGHVDEPENGFTGPEAMESAAIVVQPATSSPMKERDMNMDIDMKSQPMKSQIDKFKFATPSIVLCSTATRMASSQRGATSLTYFVSNHPPAYLLSTLLQILSNFQAKTSSTNLGDEIPRGDPLKFSGGDGGLIHLILNDRKHQLLKGTIIIRREMDPILDQDYQLEDASMSIESDEMRTRMGRPKLYLIFMRRSSGNPLEWRFLYSQIIKTLPVGVIVAK